jgi:Fe2+ transport system protein FeoA
MFKNELNTEKSIVSLDSIGIGTSCDIISMPSGILKSQLLRFGFCEGQPILCLSKLPGGTIVIRLNRQEVALGSTLAKKIKVEITK